MKLSSIKGQAIAIAKADAYIQDVKRTPNESHKPIRLEGPSGTGKTTVWKGMEQEFRAAGWKIAEFSDSGVLACAANFESEVRPLIEEGGYVFFFDEAHKLFNPAFGVSSVVIRTFQSLLMPWGGPPPEIITIPLSQGETMQVNFCNNIFCFGTNQPESMETGYDRRKGDSPVARRLYIIPLSLYTHEDMQDIIPAVLENRGLRAGETSKNSLSRYHRGNTQAIIAVSDMYKILFPDKPIIEKGRLMQAARLTDYLPRGINKTEARLLRLLAISEKGKMKRAYVAASLGIDSRALTSAISYLLKQQTSDGKPTPFVEINGAEIKITASGRVYLNEVEKEQFIF